MNLFYTTRSAYHPEGRQAKSVNHRTDYEGQMEIQWLPDINLVVTDWANKGGLGSPQRFFRPLLGVQKWARRRQARGLGLKRPQ